MKGIGLLMKSYEICTNNQTLSFFNDHCQEESIRSHVNAGNAIVFPILLSFEKSLKTYPEHISLTQMQKKLEERTKFCNTPEKKVKEKEKKKMLICIAIFVAFS